MFSTLGRAATLVTYFRELYRPSFTERVVSSILGLPERVTTAFQPPSRPPAQIVTPGRPTFRSYEASYLRLVGTLGSRLTVAMDRKTSILTITGTMPDPYAAADLVRVSSERLMERLIAYESRKAQEQVRFVTAQYRLAETRYARTERALAAFMDRNRTLLSATSQIERDRLRRDHDLAFELYQQLSRELEQARLKMNQDTPVFTVLEQVTVPNGRSSPPRARLLVTSLLVGLLVGIGYQRVRETVRPT
jgi:uncharacterized protein involved in exopolysaccharide biosynthesis